MGYEFSGKTVDGVRFMGMVNGGATANLVECDDAHMWPVPETWTLEEASTIPMCYSTVYYSQDKSLDS